MIKQLSFRINQFSQVTSWFFGLLIIIFFIYVITTGNHPKKMLEWSFSILGTTFIIIFSSLVFASLFCIFKLNISTKFKKKFWLEVGMQVSNSISIIALTFTLLGISLGIGELSSAKLDLTTINQTIGKLTEQFSMAFMTSVIGLPVSAIFKSVLIINFEYFVSSGNQELKLSKGE